jgi:hypothetical protein
VTRSPQLPPRPQARTARTQTRGRRKPRSAGQPRAQPQVENFFLKIATAEIVPVLHSGSNKYAVRECDDKIQKLFDIAHPHKNLVSAAYAEATWEKILSAFNAFHKFCSESSFNPSFPVSKKTLGHFINWAN